MSARRHVLVMAKEPVAGHVKTRLCPPYSLDEAAALAEAALADTCEAVASCGAGRRIVALAGKPGLWLPPGFEVIAQRGRSFAERLANAWRDAGGPGLQIGMDTPQVGAADLDDLLALVTPGRAVLGPALDGGWWVIGLAAVDPTAVFRGIPLSTPATYDRQRRRLCALGLSVHCAPMRRDVDNADDLSALAAEAPASRTARLAFSLGFGRADVGSAA